jgi:hypothetical protein
LINDIRANLQEILVLHDLENPWFGNLKIKRSTVLQQLGRFNPMWWTVCIEKIEWSVSDIYIYIDSKVAQCQAMTKQKTFYTWFQ